MFLNFSGRDMFKFDIVMFGANAKLGISQRRGRQRAEKCDNLQSFVANVHPIVSFSHFDMFFLKLIMSKGHLVLLLKSLNYQ